MKSSLLILGLVSVTALAGAQEMKARYGGPTYTGAPALAVTASFVKAGGGAVHFSSAAALTSMLGAKLVKAEVAKLTKQYGAEAVGNWLKVGDFAVADALKIATAAGVKLPKATLSGKKLAVAMVTAGLDKDGTFYTEFLLDKALTHNIHMKVMDDIDAKFREPVDASYHKISNQAFVDAAHALGAKTVRLAKFH